MCVLVAGPKSTYIPSFSPSHIPRSLFPRNGLEASLSKRVTKSAPATKYQHSACQVACFHQSQCFWPISKSTKQTTSMCIQQRIALTENLKETIILFFRRWNGCQDFFAAHLSNYGTECWICMGLHTDKIWYTYDIWYK